MPSHSPPKNGLFTRIADVLTVALAAFAVGYTNVLLFAGFFRIPTGTYEIYASSGKVPFFPEVLDMLDKLDGNASGIRVMMTGYAFLPVMLFILTVLFAAVSLLPKAGWGYAGLVLAGLGWIVWKRELLAGEFRDLLRYIADHGAARRVLSSLIPGFRAASRRTDTVREALLLCGLALALLTVFFLLRRRNSLWFSVPNVAAAAALCVFLQTGPAELPFLFLIAAHVMLILVSLMRRRDPASARRVLFCFTVPSVAFCLLCGFLGKHYVRPAWADEAVKRIVEIADTRIREGVSEAQNARSPSGAVTETFGAYAWNSSTTVSSLSLAGPQDDSNVPVMEIYSDTARTYYLRGMSFGRYDGETWTSWSEMPGVRAAALSSDAVPQAQLLVRTSRPTEILFLPYTPTELPARSFADSDRYVRAGNKTDAYTVLFSPNAYFAPVSSEYYNALHGAYTDVPAETADALADIVGLFDPEDPNVVYEVTRYVRGCASYDRGTRRMPPGEDFVSWFLHDSDTGYCIHFASAATVLLRLLGVPARYVTGYLAEAEGGQWTTVTQGDAHAWVEYFDESNASWRMLEATSSVNVSEEEEETVSAPTAPLPNLRGEDDAASPAERAERTEAAPVRGGRRFPTAPAILLPLLAAAVAWPFAVKAVRRVRFRRGDRNRRLLTRYRYAARLAASLGREVSAPVREAALRARFSRHPTTEEELALVAAEADALAERRRNAPNPLRRIWARYFLAL